MPSLNFKRNFKLFSRAFKYVSSYKTQIGVAIVLSLLLSATSGLAIYSFLPIFNLVFTQEATATVISANPDTTTLMAGVSNIKQTIGLHINATYTWIAGDGSTLSQLAKLVAFIIVLSTLSTLLAMLVDYIFITIQASGTMKLRSDTFNSLCKMPLSFFNKNKSGILIARIENDIGGTIAMAAGTLSGLLQNVFLSLAFFIILIVINIKLVLIMLPIILLIGFFVILMGKWVRINRLKILALQADMTAIIHEFLAGIKITKGFAAEDIEKKKWDKSIKAWHKLEIVNNINKAFPLRLKEVTAVIISGAVLIVGGHLVAKQDISPSELLLFFIVLVRFQAPTGTLANIWITIQNGMAYAERAFALLDMPIEKTSRQQHQAKFTKSLVLSNVSFDYGEGIVLQNFNAEITFGQVTALIGPSGAGKTSLVDLIMRYYEPTRGQILMDGRDIKEIILSEYRSLFGLVTQDTFLFHDTIWNNIAYGLNRKVTRKEMEATAKAANAHDFIMDFPSQYQTMLGDRGVRLSGGQRQRIAIARAILRNPQILLLDEATSALDLQSERQVQEAVDRLIENRTTIVIAHRLSTIQSADKIIVMHEGRKIDQGTHQQLLQRDGLYHNLWKMQSDTSKALNQKIS